jgi:hypothetical protein
VRIGNAHGFWGDRIGAAADMLAREPELDYLTLDFLAEVSMSILAMQRSRDADAGYARDFVEVVRSLTPYFRGGGRCRVVTNAGGLNPSACARACVEVLAKAGCGGRTVAVVDGDDVLDLLRTDARSGGDAGHLRNLDTGEAITTVADRLFTANAYMGAAPLVEALAGGADIVVTGRVADPSLAVAPCLHHFGWDVAEWDRIAGATVAGHLIECGTQVTGGVSTDWLDVPDPAGIGFPIVEVSEDGSCIVTKPAGSGGCVNERTVKEQLVYEIGDPEAYLSPDVTVSFVGITVEDLGGDRVRVSGARGRTAPESLKVSATYQDGYRAAGQLTVFGRDALTKARCAAEVVLERLRWDGVAFRRTLIEYPGAGACWPPGRMPTESEYLMEAVLRVAVADGSREAVERFTRELMPLVTAGPQGTTGYAEGRPRVHPVFRYWPCLIDRSRVTPRIEFFRTGDAVAGVPTMPTAPPEPTKGGGAWQAVQDADRGGPLPGEPKRLADIAHARSGDKGQSANIGVIARRPERFDQLCELATAGRVAEFLGVRENRVRRYELPGIAALNFVVQGILANPLRTDAQGKALGQVLLEMPID